MPRRARSRRRTRKTKRNGAVRSYHVYAPVKRHRRRAHNPSRRRAIARRVGRHVGRTIMGMNVKSALGGLPPTLIGMLAAKWACKRFPGETSVASETDPESWTWASYLKGAAGAFIAGFIAQNLRGGWGQKVFEGGLSLMAYKLVENELIPKSDWAMSQFGQDAAAVQYDANGTPYLLGQDGNYYPVDERHRLPEAMMGDVLQTPGALGDVLQIPGRLGDNWSRANFGAGASETDAYSKAFLGR